MSGPQSAIDFGSHNAGSPSAIAGDTSGDPSQDPALSNYGSPFNYSATDAASQVYYNKTIGGGFGGPGIKLPDTVTKQSQNLADAYASFRTLYTTDANAFRSYQAKLYNGGFYDGILKKGELPKFGRFDEATSKAIVNALHESARSGDAVDDVINNGANADNQAPQQITQVHKTNPDQLKASIQAVAPDILGRRAPDDVVNQIVAKYQELENGQNAQTQNGDATVQDAPSGSAWFQEQLQQLMPNTTKSYQIFQGLSAMQNSIGAPVAQLYHG